MNCWLKNVSIRLLPEIDPEISTGIPSENPRGVLSEIPLEISSEIFPGNSPEISSETALGFKETLRNSFKRVP